MEALSHPEKFLSEKNHRKIPVRKKSPKNSCPKKITEKGSYQSFKLTTTELFLHSNINSIQVDAPELPRLRGP
jgi:hypothetical protein